MGKEENLEERIAIYSKYREKEDIERNLGERLEEANARLVQQQNEEMEIIRK